MRCGAAAPWRNRAVPCLALPFLLPCLAVIGRAVPGRICSAPVETCSAGCVLQGKKQPAGTHHGADRAAQPQQRSVSGPQPATAGKVISALKRRPEPRDAGAVLRAGTAFGPRPQPQAGPSQCSSTTEQDVHMILKGTSFAEGSRGPGTSSSRGREAPSGCRGLLEHRREQRNICKQETIRGWY